MGSFHGSIAPLSIRNWRMRTIGTTPPVSHWGRDRLSKSLLAICLVVWSLCAIQPLDPITWLIEQVALLIGLAALWWCRRRVLFSTGARIGMAALFCVHSIGTHFTYSLTPYDGLIVELFGGSLNDVMGWERNHYDRFVHLVYGLSLALPFQQALTQIVSISPRAAAFLSLHLVLSTSAVYELIEWAAATIFGREVGMAYLGTQGDVWDAHADMALAGAGALVVLTAIRLVGRLGTR